jgi:hypothetical protein
MSDAETVRAVANLETAAQSGGDPIRGHFFVLNESRYGTGFGRAPPLPC